MIFSLLLIIYLILLSVSDIRTRKLPVLMLKAGATFVILYVAGKCLLDMPPTELIRRVMTALLGAFPGGALVLLSRHSDKIGSGDGVVLMLIGISESYTFSMLLICISCMALALFSGVVLCFRKINGRTCMPYIPFVTAAYVFLKMYEGSSMIL